MPVDGRRVGHYTSMKPAEALQAGLVARLAKESAVFVSERAGGVRVSPHVFNDLADIERFFEALDKALA